MANSPRVPIQNSEIVSVVGNINTFNNSFTGRDPNSQGVFGSYPFMSPKYVRHRPGRNSEYMDTMARMFIQVPPELYNSFIAGLPDEETQKIARVLTGDGVNKGGKGYFDFLLQTAQHSLTEKVQIVETLSDNYVAYFFGTSPPVWQYQGVLMNTYQDDWTMRMFRIYQELSRGTQLAKRGFILRLRYDSMIVTGAMMNFGWQLVGGAETYCRFDFSLLVKDVQIIYGGLGSPTKIDKDAQFLPAFMQTTASEEATQTVIECSSVPEGVQQSSASNSADVFPWEQTMEEWDNQYFSMPDATGTLVVAPNTVSGEQSIVGNRGGETGAEELRSL